MAAQKPLKPMKPKRPGLTKQQIRAIYGTTTKKATKRRK